MAARSPEEAHELFMQYFNSGDIDSLISLYEPGAVLVPFPDPPIQGQPAIHAKLLEFLSLKGHMELTVDRAIQADDLALLFSTWTLKGTGPDGSPAELAGQTSDIVRRQEDGSWLFVLDIPQGVAVAKQQKATDQIDGLSQYQPG